jgi:hypothetical protein
VLEETLTALQARADIVPPLALAVGEKLAARIAEIKRLKSGSGSTPRKNGPSPRRLGPATAREMVYARNIRACAVLLYGPKSRRLVHFGIKIRRRPRRMAGGPPEVIAAAPDAAGCGMDRAHAVKARGAPLAHPLTRASEM